MRSMSYAVGLLTTTLLSLTTASPSAKPSAPSLLLPVTELRSFGGNTWAENVAIRSNGQLLVTRFDTPILQLLDPTNKTAPITLHTFNTTRYSGLTGIAETTPGSDIFYVGLQTPTTALLIKSTNFSNAIFKVDLNNFSSKANSIVSAPTISHIIDIPESMLINGMSALDSEHILIADSTLGQVYNLDVSIPSYTTPLKPPSMGAPPNASSPIGINGIHYLSPYLYFDSLAASTLNRIPIAPITALPIGDSVLLANVAGPDDFAIREDGTIFLCGNGKNTLFMWKEGMSEAVAVAGSNTSTVLASVTAAAFEKVGGREGNRLWLTTGGVQTQSINGTISVGVGATVSYVDTECI
ncbi:hypothetical protein SBOR_0075 [Sclerotinia borealis F-4128]|uniref:Six-bladed beta-propeller-like protein n=1 Tax=Sclerotinia borealis (strain F-4128) TaxID=1432307 RepID=W9CY05_SCLBF|nr:hypothetical protein SBOR_0075 [Sclerotinia borealis F-4128]